MARARSWLRPFPVALGVVVIAGAVALGVTASHDGDRSASSNGQASAPKDGLPASEPLVAFKATAADGTRIDSAAIKGPALIHIYASWCPTCKAESAAFSAFLKANPSIEPIYVAVADRPALSAEFAQKYGWRAGPIIDDPKRDLATRLGMAGQPDTIFIDRAGRTRAIRGGASRALYQRYADAAVAEAPPA